MSGKSGTQTHLIRDARNSLAGGAQGIAKAGLEKTEGTVMGMFGLGASKKADGSSSNPFHVIMAGVAGAAGSVGGSVASGSSSMLGSLGGMLKGVVPFLAGGGDVDAGHPAVIGEQGPELFVPRVSGKVVSNGKFGGGTTSTRHTSMLAIANPAETDQSSRNESVHSTHR